MLGKCKYTNVKEGTLIMNYVVNGRLKLSNYDWSLGSDQQIQQIKTELLPRLWKMNYLPTDCGQ